MDDFIIQLVCVRSTEKACRAYLEMLDVSFSASLLNAGLHFLFLCVCVHTSREDSVFSLTDR